MLFLNSILLAGLVGVLIPIILHMIRRQAAKPMDWGAMRFLFDTVALRRRRMEWEDMLLMATRCLLLALIALAIARPFVPPNSNIPWVAVLPLSLLGIAAIAASVVLSRPKIRWLVRFLGLVCILLAIAAVVWERHLNLKRFSLTSGRDIAIIIDGSTSMTLPQGSQTSFDLAIEEAREVVKNSPRGTAFTVILGGPAPELKTANPLTHRADVLEVLDRLKPTGGPFRAQDALGLATLNLAQGENGRKEILVLTDSQRVGWRTDSPSAWSSLGDALDSMPTEPRLMLRVFPPPEKLRNVAISSIQTSRDAVGTDRPVSILVTIVNTGTEAITPNKLTLMVGQRTVSQDNKIGQLAPGEEEVIELSYRFTQAGPHVLDARLDVTDDIAGDNRFEHVVIARKSLPVLMVDGNPSGSFFERAAGFTALALAPGPDLKRGKTGGHLMAPRVVAAPDISTIDKLPASGVIVLADVARLPSAFAKRIEQFVAGGGGLLILGGQRTNIEFYNAWNGSDGSVLPHLLGAIKVQTDGVSPAAETFDHSSLQLFSKPDSSDLQRAQVQIYRGLLDSDASRHVIARFSNGDAFLCAKDYGKGRVILATSGFDSRHGSLPAKQTFVPFVHELIIWLAGSSSTSLNVAASWNPAFDLPGGSGLQAEYDNGSQIGRSPALTRIDPTINFDWGSRSPDPKIRKDKFTAQWSGRLLPPESGEYSFSAEVDDEMEVSINGERILWAKQGSTATGKVSLEAGKAVAIQVTYRESWGDAVARLYWSPPNGKRSIVPASVLFPPVDEETGSHLVLEETHAIDPQGIKRSAQLVLGRKGRRFVIDGSAIPGVYQIKTPTVHRGAFPFTTSENIPLAVTRDAEESHITLLNEDDKKLVAKHFDLINVRHSDDILAILSGKGFGQELWKLLAIAAFVLVLLEILLSRWISKSRRAGEEVKIDFENSNDPKANFMQALGQVKGDHS